MKKLLTVLNILLLSFTMVAQTPENMSYQAVIRDANGSLITSQIIGIQISILQGSVNGTPVFIESHTPSTNANGLVTFEIGNGTTISGSMGTIDWSNGPFFILTETDIDGGTNYSITGVSPLLAVPYALHAKTADSISGGINENDPLFSNSVAGSISSFDTAKWNQTIDSAAIVNMGFQAGAHPVNTDNQSLSLSGSNLSITNGNVIDLSTIDTDTQIDSTGIASLGFVAGVHAVNTDNQTLSLNGSTLTIAGGNNVDLSSINTQLDSSQIAAFGYVAGGHTIDTDDQTLSLSGTTLSIADGNNVDLSSINTDTQLDSSQIAAFGFVAGNHPVDTDDQTLSLSGTTLSIADGNNVDLSSIDTDTKLDSSQIAAFGFVAGSHTIDTDNQTLSLSGTTLSIADGNNVDLSSIDTDTKLDSNAIAGMGFVAGAMVTGADKQISFNDNGTVGNDAELVFNKTTNQLAIGASNISSSAALEVKSTTGGFMLPRMTTAQRDAISSPEVGLMIFNTDSGAFQGFAGFNGGSNVVINHHTFMGTLTYSGQSFTAAGNGNWTEVKLDFQSAVNNGTLQVYAGDGITGTPILTQTFNVGSGQQGIVLSSPISMQAGQQFTVFVNESCSYFPFATYGGGSAYTVSLAFPGDLWMQVITQNSTWKNLHD